MLSAPPPPPAQINHSWGLAHPPSGSRVHGHAPFSASHGRGLSVAGASSDMSPFKKKSSSIRDKSPSPSIIMMVIWNENISLWVSKMPVHV